MSKNRPPHHQTDRSIFYRERMEQGLVFPGVQTKIEDIVMDKVKTRGGRGQILLAPIDHPGMNIHPDIVFRAIFLLNKLPSNSPTTTSKIEDPLIVFRGYILKYKFAVRIIECTS